MLESFFKGSIERHAVRPVLPLSNYALCEGLKLVLPSKSHVAMLGTVLLSKVEILSPVVDRLGGKIQVENLDDLLVLSPQLESEQLAIDSWLYWYDRLPDDFQQ
jgi:hypothetical protein